MVDNNTGGPKNQSGPIFESVSFDEVPQNVPQNTQPGGFDAASEAFLNAPPPEYSGDAPPVYEQNGNKMIIIAVAVVIFLVVLAGGIGAFFMLSGPQAEPEPEPVELVYWGLWEDPEVMNALIADYVRENPHVNIKYELQEPESYRIKLIERSRNNVGPDIFRFHNTWLPQVNEITAPLPAEVMSGEQFESIFYPVHVQDLKRGEQYYGIPLTIEGMILVYNERLFSAAGIAEPPGSWIPDVIGAVSKLTVQDNQGTIVTSGMALGTATNVEHFSEIFGILLLQNGGSLETLDSRPAEEALEVYRDFADKNIWSDAMPNSVAAFAQEQVAMIIVPSWQLLTIRAMNPEIQMKTAAIPRGLDNQPISIASYWVEGVSKFSSNQTEAWRFLAYLSQQEVKQKMFEKQVELRGIGTPYSRRDMSDLLVDDPLLGPVVQQGDSYQSLPICTRTFDEGMNDANVQYLENAINAVAGGVAYSEALKTAQSGVNEVMSRFPDEE